MSLGKLICLFLVLLGFAFTTARAQTEKPQQGAVLKRGGGVRISGALILNKQSKLSVTSNQLGFFSLLSSPGDTLEISAVGYTPQSVVVSDFKDMLLYLIPVTQLNEVLVKGKSLQSELSEIEKSYRSKGVYYNGKPPLLAAVFHPLTAINELFGKNAKRARRFQEYAENEMDYQEISRKFNDLAIKNAVPITDEELPDFRSEYLPTVEQIRRWNDYDLVVYIRTSYKEFKAGREQQKEGSQKEPVKKE
ncbi:hypothetical protein [Arcticibacter sp. MXS-1]|uniref:hypothetical protein n=1 Tax=Arcticibacter sp. MXS-1 TaxID=3341726 RepID=UPI0035A88165